MEEKMAKNNNKAHEQGKGSEKVAQPVTYNYNLTLGDLSKWPAITLKGQTVSNINVKPMLDAASQSALSLNPYGVGIKSVTATPAPNSIQTAELGFAPDGKGGGVSEKLTMKFKEPSTNITIGLGNFAAGENGVGEVGQYRLTYADGTKGALQKFSATDGNILNISASAKHGGVVSIQFSALPFSNQGKFTGDSSDYTIKSVSFTTIPKQKDDHKPQPKPNIYNGTADDDVMNIKTLNNTAHGKDGHDFIRVDNAKSINKLFGQQGNDIIFSNGKKTTFDGGVGDDIMKSWKGTDGKNNENGINTFMGGDTRLYDAKNAYSNAPALLSKASSAKGAFLEGGHDVVHGRPDANGKTQDILELKGYGWSLKLITDTGSMITINSTNASNYVKTDGTIDLNSLNVSKGLAVADIKGSINTGDLTANGYVNENGLSTISFDTIAKIKFVNGGIGSSNLAHGLKDSTLTVVEKTVTLGSNQGTSINLIADQNSLVSGSKFSTDNIIFGQNDNKTIDLRLAPSDPNHPSHDLIYTGNGNKTVITDNGTDMVIGGKGNINVNLNGYGYKSFVAMDDAMHAGSYYDVKGGAGFSRIDVGSFKGDWTLTVGSKTTHYNSLTDGGNIVLGTNVSGTIKYAGGTIDFQAIDHVTY